MTVTLTCLTCRQANRLPAKGLGAAPKCGKCGAALLAPSPAGISFRTLEKAIRTDTLPLVVDFWAGWCAPCRMMAPAFSQAAAAVGPKVRFAKIDIEKNPQAGEAHAVRGIPLLAMFRNGHEVQRQAGVMSLADIVRWVSAGATVDSHARDGAA